MEEIVIPDDDGKGLTLGFIGTDVEFVNPVEYYAGWEKRKSISFNKHLLHKTDAIKAAAISEEFYEKKAKEKWDETYQRIKKAEVPPNFIALMESTSKKEQEKLLRGQGITPEQLAALLFIAHEEFGYTFSTYTTEHHHKGLDESALPDFIHVKDDGTVKTAGKTSLSEGQLKQVVSDRKVTVAKFLDKGDAWHCFFTVYRALKGEETWKGGQPHLHYISDKWTLPRVDVVAALKSTNYPKTSVHIELIGYGGKKAVAKSEEE